MLEPILLFSFDKIGNYAELVGTVLLTLLLARTTVVSKIMEIIKNSGELLEKNNNSLKQELENVKKELAEQKGVNRVLLRELDTRKSMSDEDRALIESLETKLDDAEGKLTEAKKELMDAYDRVNTKKGGVK